MDIVLRSGRKLRNVTKEEIDDLRDMLSAVTEYHVPADSSVSVEVQTEERC